MNILEWLRQAGEGFDRKTHPTILAEYKEYLKTGNYPYLDAVTDWMIARKPNFPPELKKQLYHEVYLAADQYRVEKMIAEEASWREQGFIPITEMQLVDGKKFILQGAMLKGACTLKQFGNEWAIMPPRARTRGYSFDNKLYQHKAYERAKADGRTHMQDEQVVMVKEA